MSVVSVDLNPGSIIDGLGKLVDDLFTSDEERLQAKAVLEKLGHAERMGQIQVNVTEAKHRSILVAGWRPAIGWTCAVAMLYAFVLRDLLAWALMVAGANVPAPPILDLSQLWVVLGGMLGFGAYRTFEKVKGKA